jgi:DNA recombination protein RmuC
LNVLPRGGRSDERDGYQVGNIHVLGLALQIATIVILLVVAFLVWRLRAPAAGSDADLRQVEAAMRGEFGSSRTEAAASAQSLRTEVGRQFREFADDMRKLFGDAGVAQALQLTTFSTGLADCRKESRVAAQSLREEVLKAFQALSDTVRANLGQMAQGQQNQFEAFAATLNTNGVAATASAKEFREQMTATLTRLGEAQAAQFTLLANQQGERLDEIAKKLAELTAKNEQRSEELRKSVEERLEKLRLDNEAKLEQMRLTVDEKLQSTLETRLGESFKQVSERLEQVHKGLGEMQTLATGVGDLKRVLSNVKSRGGWGEVQLGMLLDDMLTRDQFEANVRVCPDSNEIIEFAVRFPGKEDGVPLYLPIDAKFPQEDYDRLLTAQEAGVTEDIDKAGTALERAIRGQAKTICEKYVHPPHTTDFAIMYLPTEGLFAEVIRRPGLATDLQSKHRVMVTGPTTLAALLSSLQMGFRTLAIEKRSSEVWQVLGAAKAEFKKYGDVWDKLGKQLDTARKTVEDAGKRTRAVERKLRDVEAPEPAQNAADILAIAALDDEVERNDEG